MSSHSTSPSSAEFDFGFEQSNPSDPMAAYARMMHAHTLSLMNATTSISSRQENSNPSSSKDERRSHHKAPSMSTLMVETSTSSNDSAI